MDPNCTWTHNIGLDIAKLAAEAEALKKLRDEVTCRTGCILDVTNIDPPFCYFDPYWGADCCNVCADGECIPD